jgi:ethanolaminephosphotransferase
MWTVMLWPLVGGAVLGNLPRFGFPAVSKNVELGYLWAYLLFAFVVYSRWAWLVTTSICNYLGINCLTIPYEKQVANQKAARAAKEAAHQGIIANGLKKERLH